MSEWYWEAIDIRRSAAAGDLAKIFRHGTVKRPGVLQIGAPSTDATLLARETIQNSWDAARAHRKELRDEGKSTPPFEIDFRFDRLEGPQRDGFVSELGLRDHAARIGRIEPNGDTRRNLGLGPEDFLSDLENESEGGLTTLAITEQGTTGMYGPWTGTASKMWLALVSLGMTEKEFGAGGSFGYGKGGLIRGSRIRVVLAYTRFRERAEEPGVTRRFLGMTYWGLHTIDRVGHTGFAFLGNPRRDGESKYVMPWVDDEADDAAGRFGIEPRGEGESGTTFLLVDSGIGADELVHAIERNWWPVLETSDEEFEATVIDEHGEEHVPRPRRDPVLKTFIRGFELATVTQDNDRPEEFVRAFNQVDVGGEKFHLGTVGLVADEEDWSYPRQNEIDHRSLVALVRGPRMVVEYWDAGQAPPFVRGTFIADDEVDDILRGTEPMAHDAWDESLGGTDDEVGATVAKAIHSRIKSNVNRFRQSLKPPTPDQRELRLPDLERLMKGVFEGSGSSKPPPPPPPDRTVAISMSQEPAVDPRNPQQIRLEARAQLHLTDIVTSPSEKVRVRIRYLFIEDGSAGASCELAVRPPTGFAVLDEETGWYIGDLRHEPATFEIVSVGYPPDWSGRLVVESDLDSTYEEAQPHGQ